jgi:hypothetical protein
MNSQARGAYLRLLLAFVVSLLVVTPIVASWMPNTSWHRVATRSFMILLAIAFLWGAGPLRGWSAKIRGMGLDGPHRFRSVVAGLLISGVIATGLVAAQLLFDGRVPQGGAPRRSLLVAIGLAFMIALAVSYIEEILCRGYLKTKIGGPMSAFLYAIAHFVSPLHGTQPADGYDQFIAIKRFPQLFEDFGVTHKITFGVLSLFFFGMALNKLKDRTGKLYVGIGAHMGVVLVIKLSTRVVSDYPRGGNFTIWGSGRLHDGLVGTIFMGLFYLWTLKGKVPFEETPRLPET